ncbi:protein-export chaperone SecB [Pantoea ananatis]
MQFHLENNVVRTLTIDQVTSDEDDSNFISFKYDATFPEERNRQFIITFSFELKSESKFKLNLVHDFIFETDSELDDAFKNGHWTKVNAPAIAYPYLRAFVSTLLLNAGLEAISLPAVNFVELNKFMEEKNKNSD